MRKMIIAIVDDEETKLVLQNLTEEGYPVSRIDSTGGLLRRGSSTLIIGSEEGKVNQALEIINQSCEPSINPLKGKATIMVLNVDHFEQLA